MRAQLLLLLVSVLTAGHVYAQVTRESNLDLTIAGTKKQLSFSGHHYYIWKPGKNQRFGFGVGGRLTSYAGSDQHYITAPAKLTSGSTSPLIFFTGIMEENIDTFLIKSPQINSLNLSINLQYRIFKKLVAGFNIDAIGISIGARQKGTYINGSTRQNESAKPSFFNVLLISDNDRGSLNSELYLKYPVTEKHSIKVGLQFLFTEYTTKSNVQQEPSENDRFRLKSFMLGIGLNLKL